ncbi:MAG: histidine phosphatase family protein [Paludibacteraceae bacterium]|nr:histidine phosphatase family protein [Paludibacteraceae bacterium]
MVKLFLTRHGQTEWNVEKRMQGQMDSNLTDLGRKQAEALGKRLADEKIDVIYSSPLGRALDTAKLIRGNRTIEILTDEGLMELYLGPWQGRLLSEVSEEFPTQTENFWKHPKLYERTDAESYFQLLERASNAIARIAEKEKGKNVLIVTHGIVLKTLRAYFQYQGIDEIANYPKSPLSTALSIVEQKDGRWNIRLWNDTAHYEFIQEETANTGDAF